VDVPLHFTAFHPDYRMLETPHTPAETLATARQVAMDEGLHYVYVGNVLDPARHSTYCPRCGRSVIERHWHDVLSYQLVQGCCRFCGQQIAGHFSAQPGHWGTRRLPVDPASLLKTL
jgi:pyruvate formate lyase activating enzyme